ncbi:MAG: hypothetical protein J0H99_04125, partial [Rhodospirillales bacterium]|nr:hypothetical protein [Rhodospirillales bacterium]
MNKTRRDLLLGAAAVAGTFGIVAQAAQAASAQQIERDARQALQSLYAAQPEARRLVSKAKAVLIFPKIIKAGLLIGGQTGDGVLLAGNKPEGYYNITAASFGLQAGAQRFSFALFFMNDEALRYL